MKKNTKNMQNELFDENSKSKIIHDVLSKKAIGYDVTETTEEYSVVDGEMVLSKKKVSTKSIPPDMTAVKILLDTLQLKELNYKELSDEELEKEKQRLLKMLKDLSLLEGEENGN